MNLTDEQKQEIFEEAQQIIDKHIEENGYFDDTNTNDLENIIIDITTKENNIDELITNYDRIIDLTTDFLTWLFSTNCYDKNYYENMCYIRKKI